MGQGVDVLAIERRDESAVQPLQKLLGERVAAVFNRVDLGRPLEHRPIGRHHLLEQPRCR